MPCRIYVDNVIGCLLAVFARVVVSPYILNITKSCCLSRFVSLVPEGLVVIRYTDSRLTSMNQPTAMGATRVTVMLCSWSIKVLIVSPVRMVSGRRKWYVPSIYCFVQDS